MARNFSSDMMLPPFRGAVRQITIASAAIYVVILLLMSFAQPTGQAVLALGILQPAHIVQGWLWQFVTYAFMYVDPLDFVLSVAGIYFLGASVEDQVGTAAFYGLFFSSIILSGFAGFLLSLTGVIAHGEALGCGAAVNAILMVFYLFNRGAPLMLFPLPIQIPATWIVWGTAGIETAYLLLNHFALFYCVLLLGLGAGYLWYYAWHGARAGKRTSMRLSERLYGARNAYYRWRRRQAAKKFEVYMRKHDRDVHFDEHGNYIPPDDDPRKGNGGSKSGWVN
jgi:membrane associated rhomboid family serine protease